ncbi:hypothetical protein HX882_04340 [Pseudomonas gingeri]|uniref:Uncharacterized protein n=1 Tax=Pseudomonas gingeri TaxID=117681 RepID=A0A7Y7X8R2_9PSED|nr:hypothetical protein [Pseudomonas gingeri]NWA26220.1 hypothetical protein [Pseudomonas gingeri]NWB95121.1 hypothetical protein [Pseudomonas gingeri]NWD75289.1 hypothetical protein [Pseudomonas gingeri]
MVRDVGCAPFSDYRGNGRPRPLPLEFTGALAMSRTPEILYAGYGQRFRMDKLLHEE